MSTLGFSALLFGLYLWTRRHRREYGEIEIRFWVDPFREWLLSKGIDPIGTDGFLADEGETTSLRLRTIDGFLWRYECDNRLFIDSGMMAEPGSPFMGVSINLYATQEANKDIVLTVVTRFFEDKDQRMTLLATIPFADFYEYKSECAKAPGLDLTGKAEKRRTLKEKNARSSIENSFPGRIHYGRIQYDPQNSFYDGFCFDFVHFQYVAVLSYRS